MESDKRFQVHPVSLPTCFMSFFTYHCHHREHYISRSWRREVTQSSESLIAEASIIHLFFWQQLSDKTVTLWRRQRNLTSLWQWKLVLMRPNREEMNKVIRSEFLCSVWATKSRSSGDLPVFWFNNVVKVPSVHSRVPGASWTTDLYNHQWNKKKLQQLKPENVLSRISSADHQMLLFSVHSEISTSKTQENINV